MQAQKLVWEGAIPLQVQLHQSEVTTLPPPSPALVSPSTPQTHLLLLLLDFVPSTPHQFLPLPPQTHLLLLLLDFVPSSFIIAWFLPLPHTSFFEFCYNHPLLP